MLIKLENICKSFYFQKKEIAVLKGINLELDHGDFVAISGKSGSGKTTLLNIISGIIEPTSGTLYVNGDTVTGKFDKTLSKFRSEHIGFVFQSFNLIPYLTVLENVITPLKLSDIPPEEHNRIGIDILNELGLGERLHFYPTLLSGGQMQRTAIARALVKNPSLIIADEPTGNLDNSTAIELFDIFKKLNEERKITFIIVTHDKKVQSYTDKIFELKDGQLNNTEILITN